MYSVFLVEDEVVTREGIRDSVDWAAAGYRFCGEAPDGEIALPLICERRPDVVVTDIKMPFMDGLQLCRVLRETLPETRVIILSGHDEFRYAQEAIQVGVTEYLLKPIAPVDLLAALRKVAQQLDRTRRERAQLLAIQDQVASQRQLLRERCLRDLVAGSSSPATIIEQCRSLGLDIMSPWYQVLVLHAEPESPEAPDALRPIEAAVSAALRDTPGALRFRNGDAETVLILKGESAEALRVDAPRLAALLRQEAARHTRQPVAVGMGEPVARLGAVAQSFSQASAAASSPRLHSDDVRAAPRRNEPPATDPAAVERFLRSGSRAELASFIDGYLQPHGGAEHLTRVLLEYLCADAIFTAAGFIRELGGDPETSLPELRQFEQLLAQLPDLSQIRAIVGRVLTAALEYRDSQSGHQHGLVRKARDYIDQHYADPDISLGSVAAHVTLSPSYLSVVFSREVGETFIEYLTNVRIRKAMELLRSTALTSSEIAYRVGYHNPRYFYAVFRKVTGQSPIEFRKQP